MLVTVDDLIALLDGDDARGEDAAHALADYLAQGPPPAKSAVPVVLDLKLHDSHAYNLTSMFAAEPDEPWDEVVDGLIGYVTTREKPRVSAIWALGKAHAPRTEAALIAVLNRHVETPEDEDLAFEALVGLKSLPDPPLDAIQVAADRGVGDVAVTARRYLELARAQ